MLLLLLLMRMFVVMVFHAGFAASFHSVGNDISASFDDCRGGRNTVAVELISRYDALDLLVITVKIVAMRIGRRASNLQRTQLLVLMNRRFTNHTVANNNRLLLLLLLSSIDSDILLGA